MVYNRQFTEATRRQQEKAGMTQTVFAKHIGTSQSTLSKFYKHGIKDNIVIKILRKYPEFAIFFRSEDNT